MSLVVLDIECIENKIKKELGVYENEQTVGYSFLPSKKFKATSQSAWYLKHLHGINWRSGHERFTEFEKMFKRLKAVINFERVSNLGFKDKEYDWRCSNYPFRHAKILHCA